MKQQIVNFAGKVTYEWDSKNLYDVIEFIRFRPAFAIGNSPKTITNLYIYLRAYQDALASTKLLDYGLPDFSHFSTWTCGIRKKGALAASWDYHILHMVRNNQTKAYDLFFELIDQYKKSTISAVEAILTEKNKEVSKNSKTKRYNVRSLSDENEENIITYPHRIVIFKIGESDSRWTVFFNEMMSPTYQTFTDKQKEPFKQSETEFGIKKNQWKQLTSQEALNLYKKTFKHDADQFGMTITSTQF